MPKYKNGYYLQMSRGIFKGESNSLFHELSASACKLWLWLHELEQKFTGVKKDKNGKKKEVDWFFRSDQELANDTHMGTATIKRAKAELKQKCKGKIQIFQMHFLDPKTGKKSHKHVTGYRILGEKYRGRESI
jgi:hypothetical protein